MTTASTVLILGARGRFGQAAAHAFADAGWQVVAQMRPGGAALPLDGVRWIEARPEDTATLAAQAGAASVVVQARCV
jgi:NAD(P)-dependent dehydrogenase (short-subunit alcohol dehydrogenase family)